MTSKPRMGHRAGILARALLAVITRRPLGTPPGTTAIRHSSEVRSMVMVLTLAEIPLAFLVSGILPPAGRIPHAVLELALILTGFGVLAAMARNPHTVSADRVALRTGFMGGLELPRPMVRSANQAMRTIEGRGLRRVPNEASAVACSIGSSVNVRLLLEEPLPVELGDGQSLDVDTVYISADSPEAITRALKNSAVHQ
ncbi:hypothetical protein [Streptomyces violarus]|uniref:hypothetical protein n=1 Tax=Streptomyces violarus TaxID=67380 RepID=UPI0021BF8F1E|nr:hypothetical protein [Streptomyces violarus]MCT9140741.1 hypothetical protein [Streptomyces violarus]